MLSTLFKYEFKNTYKVMLTLYGVLAAFTILGMLFISSVKIVDGEHSLITIFLLVYLLLYILAIFACFIITIIYLTVHFYKTMYSAQGYLTLTLPVSPITTFHVKLLTSAIWMFLSFTLVFASLFGLLAAVASHLDMDYITYTLDNSKALYMSSIGMRSGEYIAYMIIAYLLMCFLNPLRLYVSCSIGQLFNQQKVTASIIIGIILFFAHSSITSTFTNLVDFYVESENLLFSDTAWLLLCFDLLFVILFYIGNVIIIKKHINLE